MDPFLISIIVVVVTYLITVYTLLRGNTTFHAEQTGSVTVRPQQNTSKDEITSQEGKQQDNSTTSQEFQETSTQTDDSAAFYTFYKHTQAQRQETLLLEEQLDRALSQFNRSLHDIIEHQDKNFQFLTHQLRCEFNAYMQFALSNAVNRVIPIPPPLRFNHPGSANFPPVPDFRAAYNTQFVEEFDKIEVEIQNGITEQEAKGARPPEKQRPWSQYPFGRRTCSQEQYAKRQAQREEYLERKRQTKSHEILVSAAVQATLSPTTLHRPTREDAEAVPIRGRRVEHVSNTVATITEIEENEYQDNNDQQPESTGAAVQDDTGEKRPQNYSRPYYYPDVPQLPFGRGKPAIARYVQIWLADNPTYTEKNFWECQVAHRNYTHIPSYVMDAHHPPLDADPEQYQDAQE